MAAKENELLGITGILNEYPGTTYYQVRQAIVSGQLVACKRAGQGKYKVARQNVERWLNVRK